MRKINGIETVGLALLHVALIATTLGWPHPEVIALAGIGYVIVGRR